MGTFFSAQLAAKHMASQKNGGSIVMIASVASHCAIPSQRLAMYGASKGAVRVLAKHLAVELAPYNIRVNTISPGYIATEMTEALGIKYPELLSVFESAAPMKRMGDRKDLKGIVGYLLTDAAAYTTGADIEVTGGLHAGRI
jgi:sorbose reductase